jgi:hypothetical protein
MQLAISTLTSLKSSYLFFLLLVKKRKIQANIVCDVVSNGALLLVDGKSIFLDF